MTDMHPGGGDDPRDDTALVLAARDGEPAAYGELFRRWFDRSYDVARGICRDRETAAEVTQDAFLVCWQGLAELRDPAAFGGWILRTTRNRALNRLERERTRSHQPLEADDEERWPMTDDLADPVRAAEIADRQRLVRTAAGTLGERDLSLLDLHLRHGLEPSEIAAELGVTPNNAHQLLFRLRNKLRDAIGAALLWRDGRPSCGTLAALVPAGAGFDAGTAATVRRHQKDCSPCTAELGRQTHPERLFAALPIAVAPLALRDRVAAELARLGVPVDGTASAATDPDGGTGRDGSTGPDRHQDEGSGSTAPRSTIRRGPALAVAASILLVTAGAVTAVQASRQPPAATTAATGTGTTPAAGGTSSAPVPVAAPGTGTPSAGTPGGPTAGRPATSSRPPADPTTATDPAPATGPSTPAATPTVVLAVPTATLTVTGPVDLTAPNRCTSTQLRWLVTWKVTAATEAMLTVPGGTLPVDPAGGSTRLCLAPGDVAQLTVQGPGGTASASDTADLSPAG